MAQHDYILDNQDGASFRADINSVLAAIASCNSGATAPATTYAYQVWHDTTTGLIKQRNATNTAWVNLADVLLADKSINGLLTYTNQLTLSTSQATTSGTVKDFTGIPGWVNRITMMLDGVSTNGTSPLLFQLGTSGGVQTSGYNTANTRIGSVSVIAASSSAGWQINSATAASASRGAVTFARISGNVWVGTGTVASSEPAVSWTSGSKDLGDVLTQLRITTVNGTDTFDAGSVNILYE